MRKNFEVEAYIFATFPSFPMCIVFLVFLSTFIQNVHAIVLKAVGVLHLEALFRYGVAQFD
jgi:hypothetical protein